MEQSNVKKALIIISGIAFLSASLLSIGELIASSLKEPVAKENSAQSQNAQLNATEKGFLGVLKREPTNQTALQGIQEIVNIRMQQGDIPGTKAILKQLIEIEPTRKDYKEFLAAIEKQQLADSKKVATPKTTEPTSPTKPAK
jgi:hypothetical protein